MAITLDLFRNGDVGFIDWLDLLVARKHTDKNSIARLRWPRHGGVMLGRTIDIPDGYAKDRFRFARAKAPLMKGCSSGIIKYAMTGALYRVHAVDDSIRANLQRKNTAAHEVSCLSFCRILRRWSEGGIFLFACVRIGNSSNETTVQNVRRCIGLTRLKISDRAGERASLQDRRSNYPKAAHRSRARFAASPG